jgi:S-adenosyl-L-methionine hydrolase (adenosine-forming)
VPGPIVTLTSDFGAGSPYVAAMKAVLLGACPGAVLVDVSHTVPPFDVVSGAFVLWAGTRHFARGAVHVAVVDPGVGTERRPVALRVQGSWYVGPDNGLLGLILEEGPPDQAIELHRPPTASATFEGRDVFAPAAATLAAGGSPAELGRPLATPPLGLPVTGPAVLWVDGFGNLVTNLRPPPTGVRVQGHDVRQTARTFGDVPPGAPFTYTGSMGYVVIAVREGRADQLLGARAGTPIEPLG